MRPIFYHQYRHGLNVTLAPATRKFASVDDAMAILAAFNSQDVEIIGLTTLFGNVRTPQATANAIVLRELAGRKDVRRRTMCTRSLQFESSGQFCHMLTATCFWLVLPSASFFHVN